MLNVRESNVTIMVRDMDRAVKFYESIGLTTKARWGDHYAMMTTTGITLGLHPAEENFSPGSHISIGFIIDDIGDAKKILEENKISYEENSDKAGIFASFRDPDGTILYFMQPLYGKPDNA